MNKIFLPLVCICLMSCSASKSVSPLVVTNNSVAKIEIDSNLEVEPVKVRLKIHDKAVTLLNQLFNSDEANKNMVLIINNESDCDFTMNIVGEKSYSLPVAAKKTESVVVERGEYIMRSEVCKSSYLAKKTLSENTQVSIKYSVVKVPAEEKLATNQ